MATVRAPYFKVVYESVDITEEISKDVVEITYSDSTENEAAELVIVVDDMFSKWKNEWIVNTGVKIQCEIGWSKDTMLDCGTFEVDEIHYSGDYGKGATVEIRCLAISENSTWRQELSYIYTNQTFQEIIQQIAARNNVTYQGVAKYTVEQETLVWEQKVLKMRVNRLVQDRESDIGFLNRVMSVYGFSFIMGTEFLHGMLNITYQTSVPSSSRLYYSEALPEDDGYVTIDGRQIPLYEVELLKSYQLKNCAKNTISAVELKYHDPFTNELYQVSVDYDSLPPGGKVNPLQREMNSFLRKESEYAYIENKQQAEIIAKAKLFKAISKQIEGDMELEGQPSVVSGTAIEVSGIGKLSGRYFVNRSRHRISRAGYVTNIQVNMLESTSP